MGLQRLVGTAMFGAALFLGAGAALAEESGGSKLPVPYAERPLTLPKFVLSPEATLVVDRVGFTGVPAEVGFGMELGAHFGITDDFEVGATLAKISFAPSPVRYDQPGVEATYRFLKGGFEIGGRLGLTFVTQGSGGMIIQPGLPMRAHFGKSARLDTGVFIPVGFGFGGGDPAAGLSIPVSFGYDITEPLHVGANTGFQIVDFKDAGHNIAIPLGIFAGYVITKDDKPLLDIDPFFRWPFFATPGVPSPGDKVQPGIFETGVSVAAFFYL